MNVFNLISAGGGSGSGLYIWKKHEYLPSVTITNPTFYLDNSGTSAYRCYITSEDFDARQIPNVGNENSSENLIANALTEADNEIMAMFDFFDGFKCTDSDNPQVKFLKARVAGNDYSLRYGNNSYLYVPTGYKYSETLGKGVLWLNNSTTVNITTAHNFAYTGTKTLPASIGDMVGFVVSDKEDAYPDKGEQGGFYYERFEPLEEGVFGCTKMETGVFVPTQYNGLVTVEHSLGVIPKMCLAWQEENTSYCSNTWTVFNNAGSGASYAELYSNKTARQYGNAGDGATVTRCPFSAYGNSPAWFGAGLTYHYIIFA